MSHPPQKLEITKIIIQKQTENKYRDPIDVKVEEWSKGRETNVRGLLASLHEVLWEGHNWKPISVGELLQVKFTNTQLLISRVLSMLTTFFMVGTRYGYHTSDNGDQVCLRH